MSRLEREIEDPSIGIVERLVATLGVSIAALFAEPQTNDIEPQQPKP